MMALDTELIGPLDAVDIDRLKFSCFSLVL